MKGERHYVSVVEAAKMLGWSENTVRRMVKADRIDHIRASRRGSIRIALDGDGRPKIRAA